MPNLELSKTPLSGWPEANLLEKKKNEACLGRDMLKRKKIQSLSPQRDTWPPSGTVSSSFWFSWHLPQLWWRERLALSVPWGIGAFSEWSTRHPFCYHANHTEYIFHSQRSLDPHRNEPFIYRRVGPAKGTVGSSGRVTAITHLWNQQLWFTRLALCSLPLGFWDTSLGFPTCLSQMMVSLNYNGFDHNHSCLQGRIWLRKYYASPVFLHFLPDANRHLRRSQRCETRESKSDGQGLG